MDTIFGWNLDEWQKFSSALQSLTLAVAALVGGVWAMLRFRVLLEAPNARATLISSQNATAQAQASAALAQEQLAISQRTNFERGTLEVGISAKGFRDVTGGYYIKTIVKIKNVGNKADTITWLVPKKDNELAVSGALYTALLTGREKIGVPKYGEWITTRVASKGIDVEAFIMFPGETKEALFVVPVEHPGTYLQCIEVPSSKYEAELSSKVSGYGKSSKFTWSVESIVTVSHNDAEKK